MLHKTCGILFRCHIMPAQLSIANFSPAEQIRPRSDWFETQHWPLWFSYGEMRVKGFACEAGWWWWWGWGGRGRTCQKVGQRGKWGPDPHKSLIPTTVALTRAPLAGPRPVVACKYLAASRLPRSTTKRPSAKASHAWLLEAQLLLLGFARFAKSQSLKQRDNRMFVLHLR